MHSAHRRDVAIIGAGPVGLFAVFECGMLEMRCHVFDALDSAGGQCAALYPEKPIYDIPGYPRIDAAELIDRLAEQAAPFAPVYHLGAAVAGLREAEGGFVVETGAGELVAARAVIVAAGAGAFGPNRPPLSGLDRIRGQERLLPGAPTRGFPRPARRHRRRRRFRGRLGDLAGRGRGAGSWSCIAARASAPPRNRPRSSQRLAEEGRIELVIPYQLHGLEGAGGDLSGVIVADLDGKTRRLEADCLLPFFGLATDLGPIAEWGLALDHNHIAVDPATCASSRPGIFAIGDIAAYPGKLKLILLGLRGSGDGRACDPPPASIPARRCISNTRRQRACRPHSARG